MKKLLVSAAAIIMLAGCGGSKTESKTCSIKQSGMEMNMTLEAKDKKLVKQTVEMKLPKTLLEAGGKDFDKMTDAELKEMAKTFSKSSDETKGVSVDFEKTSDGITVSAVGDIEKMDEASAKFFKDKTLEDFTKELTAAGYTCK